MSVCRRFIDEMLSGCFPLKFSALRGSIVEAEPFSANVVTARLIVSESFIGVIRIRNTVPGTSPSSLDSLRAVSLLKKDAPNLLNGKESRRRLWFGYGVLLRLKRHFGTLAKATPHLSTYVQLVKSRVWTPNSTWVEA